MTIASIQKSHTTKSYPDTLSESLAEGEIRTTDHMINGQESYHWELFIHAKGKSS